MGKVAEIEYPSARCPWCESYGATVKKATDWTALGLIRVECWGCEKEYTGTHCALAATIMPERKQLMGRGSLLTHREIMGR